MKINARRSEGEYCFGCDCCIVIILIGATYVIFRFAGQRSFQSPTTSMPVAGENKIIQQPTLIEDSKRPKESKDSEPISEETSKTKQSLPVNFSETGVILDWDAQREIHTNEWRFLYDKPGALALTVKLELDKKSICDLGNGEKNCDKSEFVNGTTVMLEGNRNNGEVTVVKMKKFTM